MVWWTLRDWKPCTFTLNHDIYWCYLYFKYILNSSGCHSVAGFLFISLLLFKSHLSDHIILENENQKYFHIKLTETFFCLFSFSFACLSRSIKNIVSSKAFSFFTAGHGLLRSTFKHENVDLSNDELYLDSLHVQIPIVRSPVSVVQVILQI